jgi:hypothetical protein
VVGGGLVLGGGLLELGELEFELLDQPGAALAGGAEPLAAGLGQEQPQALDLERGGRDQALGALPRLALGQDHGVRGGEVGGQRFGLGRHERDASTAAPILEDRTGRAAVTVW